MSKQLLDTASKHPFSVAGLADRAWNRITETAFNTGWSPLTRLAEAAVVACVEVADWDVGSADIVETD